MKKIFTTLTFATLLFALTALTAFAQTTTNLVVTPSYAGIDPTANNVLGVQQDAAPGFNFGSMASNGIGKSNIQFTPMQLFKREVTIGEIETISYWTKTGAVHSVTPGDWYINIYTKPYAGDVSPATWYGDRIGTEPYFSANINDPANTWNQWTTDGPDNMLRFFESTLGYFGSYTDPFWNTFKNGTALSGQPYANKEILSITLQTGSGWAAGFSGKLDGLRIELTDGSVATVNFEPFMVATSPDACKKNGWMGLKRADGTGFSNQGDCVSYVNTGN